MLLRKLQQFVIKSPERSQLLLVQWIIHSVLTGGAPSLTDMENGFTHHPPRHHHTYTEYTGLYRDLIPLLRVCMLLYTTLCDCMECSPPGSSVHGILQQEYWRGLPCPPPGDLPNPGIKPTSPVSPALQVDSLATEPPGKPNVSPLKRTQR